MAAPHVSGVAALILSVNPNISLRKLRGALIYSGDPASSLLASTVGGHRLSAYNALKAAAENDSTPPGAVTDLKVTEQSGRDVSLS